MNILVVGQSHVAAFSAAARIRREADPDRPRTRVIHTLDPVYAAEFDATGAAFSPALRAAIADQVARHAPIVASAIGGNYHKALALVRHPRPFDFHLSGEPSPPFDREAELIPEALVRGALIDGLARDRLRLGLFAEAVGRFVQVESPPPLRDDKTIAAAADPYFRERGLAQLGVASAGLRYRMWRLNARLFRVMTEAAGGRYLPVPAEACDAEGFLRPELAGDATHGNAAFGEIMIRALESSG